AVDESVVDDPVWQTGNVASALALSAWIAAVVPSIATATASAARDAAQQRTARNPLTLFDPPNGTACPCTFNLTPPASLSLHNPNRSVWIRHNAPSQHLSA